jgi:hypothetical protein
MIIYEGVITSETKNIINELGHQFLYDVVYLSHTNPTQVRMTHCIDSTDQCLTFTCIRDLRTYVLESSQVKVSNNRCMLCGIDMGEYNHRQLCMFCMKSHCEMVMDIS